MKNKHSIAVVGPEVKIHADSDVSIITKEMQMRTDGRERERNDFFRLTST